MSHGLSCLFACHVKSMHIFCRVGVYHMCTAAIMQGPRVVISRYQPNAWQILHSRLLHWCEFSLARILNLISSGTNFPHSIQVHGRICIAAVNSIWCPCRPRHKCRIITIMSQCFLHADSAIDMGCHATRFAHADSTVDIHCQAELDPPPMVQLLIHRTLQESKSFKIQLGHS